MKGVIVRGAVSLPRQRLTLSTYCALILDGSSESLTQGLGAELSQFDRQLCLLNFRTFESGQIGRRYDRRRTGSFGKGRIPKTSVTFVKSAEAQPDAAFVAEGVIDQPRLLAERGPALVIFYRVVERAFKLQGGQVITSYHVFRFPCLARPGPSARGDAWPPGSPAREGGTSVGSLLCARSPLRKS
jgi:hypothetical protein